MSFFQEKKAPAASRRAHKKSFKQHQQHKNKTRTRKIKTRNPQNNDFKWLTTIKIINDTFSAKQWWDYQSGTSKLQQKFNNRQNIQEKNEIDHNFNIELSILNIKISFNTSFFWLSSWWWSKSSKLAYLIKKLYFLFKLYIF